MGKLVIVSRITKSVVQQYKEGRFLSFRLLSASEMTVAKRFGLRRYNLPALNEQEAKQFFDAFGAFWDPLIDDIGTEDRFWRLNLSSKMQEWEQSLGYLLLALFTICRKLPSSSQTVIAVCSMQAEADLFEKAAQLIDIRVERIDGGFKRSIRLSATKAWLKLAGLCVYRKSVSPGPPPSPGGDRKTVLISSLFYPHSLDNGVYKDPFFGALHHYLEQNGFHTVYLSHPLKSYRESVRKAVECSDATVVSPYSYISWRGLGRILLRSFPGHVMKRDCRFLGLEVTTLVDQYSNRVEPGFGLLSELYHDACEKITKQTRFERMIQLFEGNVFERGCIQGFRKNSSAPIIGYSHAVVFPINLKLFLTEKEKQSRPEPDRFVCAGPENKRMFDLHGNRIDKPTSNGCALRSIPEINTGKPERPENTVLIALDGVTGSVALLDWLFEHAGALTEFRFRVRAHPNVPLDILLSQVVGDIPGNVDFSETSLEADLESCFCTVYRQTSVGLQSLMNGIPAIHLNIDAPLACDPICGLDSLKWVVDSPEGFIKALQEISALDTKEIDSQMESVRQYSAEYFAAPTPDSMQEFLN